MSDSNGPPPPKRARHIHIDDQPDQPWLSKASAAAARDGMIGAGTTTSSAPTQQNPEKFVRMLDESVEHSAPISLIKTRSKFVISGLPEDPEALLAGIIQYTINTACQKSRDEGYVPDRLGCTIRSDMLDPDVWIPVREISENTVDTILNRFLHVAQSKSQDDAGLLGTPFTITITTIDRSRIPKTQRRLKGGAPRRTLAPVQHQIDERNLIKVNHKKK